MTANRAGRPGTALLGLAFLALLWPETASAQVKLEYKYPEGKKFSYKGVTKTKQVLTLMGMEIETESTENVSSSLVIGKKRSDGGLPVEERIDSLRAELSLPGGVSITYDTKEPDAKIETPGLAFLGEIFKMAGDMTYTIVLDDKSNVKAVEGTEKLLEKADKLSEAARDSIRSRLEADKLKLKFEQDHKNVPDILARPGEPWQRTEVMDIGGGQVLTVEKKYTYVGVDKKDGKSYDKISAQAIKVDFKQDPQTKSPLKVVKSELKVETSTGTILFDREVGQVFDAKGKTHYKGTMTFEAAGMEIPGQIDLIFDTNTQLQPTK